jgi:hypothetical protein
LELNHCECEIFRSMDLPQGHPQREMFLYIVAEKQPFIRSAQNRVLAIGAKAVRFRRLNVFMGETLDLFKRPKCYSDVFRKSLYANDSTS